MTCDDHRCSDRTWKVSEGSEQARPPWIVRVVNHAWFDPFFSVVVLPGGILSLRSPWLEGIMSCLHMPCTLVFKMYLRATGAEAAYQQSQAEFPFFRITNSVFIGIDVELNPSAMGPRSSIIVAWLAWYPHQFQIAPPCDTMLLANPNSCSGCSAILLYLSLLPGACLPFCSDGQGVLLFQGAVNFRAWEGAKVWSCFFCCQARRLRGLASDNSHIEPAEPTKAES